ncbi:hypothetical protein AB0G04_22455 [Actinoplanes sp. NPDC023801]|uniref:hypothetical protein n=1 Tax=Actinoplanes sp. NPDC023801 TaxID=3154595 RepID=UPI0033E67362
MPNPLAALHGLARNPALPVTLLLRLAADDRITPWDLTARRTWTDEAFDALAAHPDPEVREALARSPGATGGQRARLAGDLSIRVLQALLEGPPARWSDPLPGWVHHRLAGHPEPLVRDLLTYLPGTPRDVVATLARDPHPGIADAARALLDRKPYEPTSLGTGQAVLFAASDSEWNRERAAADPALPAAWVTTLAADPSPRVRLAVSQRPELTEEQRAAIDYPACQDTPLLDWVLAAGPAELRRCARSAHPGLRRSAACHPGLPSDLVGALAADSDPAVRALLCAYRADVPGDLVLHTYLDCLPGSADVTGSSGFAGLSSDDLVRHPAFPRTGLARLSSSPDERARALVPLDPAAPAALIEQLSHDPSAVVRAAAASDPRIPSARLLELLEDPATTAAAAANPSLPLPVIERLMAAAEP